MSFERPKSILGLFVGFRQTRTYESGMGRSVSRITFVHQSVCFAMGPPASLTAPGFPFSAASRLTISGTILKHAGIFRSPVIQVKCQHINQVITGVAFKVFLLRLEPVRGIAVQQMMDLLFIPQVGDRKPPERLILFGSAQVLTPPEPAAGMFMIRPEYNGHIGTFFGFQAQEKIRQAVKILHIKFMLWIRREVWMRLPPLMTHPMPIRR